MDKIFSRRRIKVPKIKNIWKKSNEYRKKHRIITVIICFISIILLIKMAINYINPMYDSMCNLRAKGIATRIVNQEAKKSLENVDYNDLITIIRDNDGNITMVKANVISINRIASELTLEIQRDLENETETEINIPLGSFLGNELFYNIGPNIPVRLTSSGSVTTEFKSQFTNSGINQTIHRIYLYTVCKVNIITPLKTIASEITNEVLVAETVLVGPIPDTYYNIEGVDLSSDAIEFIN